MLLRSLNKVELKMNKIIIFFFQSMLIKIIVMLSVIGIAENLQSANVQTMTSTESFYISKFNKDSSIVKQVRLYVVNNKVDKVVASILLSYCKKNGKLETVKAKIEKNGIDNFNIVKIIKVDFDRIEFITLKVGIQSCKNIKDPICVDYSITSAIILGESSRGTLCSLTPTPELQEADLRFGGQFINQVKGEFKTTVVKGNCK